MFRFRLLPFACLALLAGCGGTGPEYVLREPLEVRVGPGGEAVTVPAGTRVRQWGFKEDEAFVEVYGTASRSRLARSADEQARPAPLVPMKHRN